MIETLAAIILIGLVAFVFARHLFGASQGRSGSWVAPDDPQILAAEEEAKSSLPDFLRRLDQPAPDETEFMVKFRLRSGDTAEQIWAEQLVRRDGRLHGRLANCPVTVPYSEGQEVEIPEADILDWGYRSNGIMQGHFSTRALMPRMPKQAVGHICEQFGWSRPISPA